MENSLRMTMFSQKNYKGRRIRINRGSIAIRDMHALRFSRKLSSFRIRNIRDISLVTLILFSSANFRGRVRVFRGSHDITNLSKFDFNNKTRSMILVCGRVSDEEIEEIKRRRRPHINILEISD